MLEVTELNLSLRKFGTRIEKRQTFGFTIIRLVLITFFEDVRQDQFMVSDEGIRVLAQNV